MLATNRQQKGVTLSDDHVMHMDIYCTLKLNLNVKIYIHYPDTLISI